MNRYQTIRIALLLAMIFAGGFLVGRLTVPRPPVSFSTVDGRTITADVLLAHVSRVIKLDAAQETRVRPFLEEATEQMSHAPIGTQARLDIFRNCMRKIREQLHPDQYAAFDQFVKVGEQRYQNMIR